MAALTVVFYHFASAFFPVSVGEGGALAHTKIDSIVYKTPLSAFIAGNFAVVLFFVLSGFVLTVRYYAGDQKSLFPSAAKRYFRLMPVAFASVILGYLLMSLGLMHSHGAGLVAGSRWLGDTFFTFDPHIVDAIKQGLVGIFTQPSDIPAFRPYNPVLWTIYYELIGSLLVFGLATLCRKNNKRWLVYTIALTGFIGTYFSAFILGAILADVHSSLPKFTQKIKDLRPFYKVAMLLFIFLTAGYQLAGTGNWEALKLFDHNNFMSRMTLQLVDATFLIMLALYSRRAIKLLSHRALIFFGKISYGLYAVHFLLIFSLASWLFIKFIEHFTYIEAAALSFVVSLPIIIFVAYLFTKYIEAPCLALANRVGEWAKK